MTSLPLGRAQLPVVANGRRPRAGFLNPIEQEAEMEPLLPVHTTAYRHGRFDEPRDAPQSVYVDVFMGRLDAESIAPAVPPRPIRRTGWERELRFPGLVRPQGQDDYCLREFARIGTAFAGGAAGHALLGSGVSPMQAKLAGYGIGCAASHPVGAALCVAGTTTALAKPALRAALRNEELFSADNRADCAAWARTVGSYLDPSAAGGAVAAVRALYPERIGEALANVATDMAAPPIVQTMSRTAETPARNAVPYITSPAREVTEHLAAVLLRCCEKSCEATGACIGGTCEHVVLPGLAGGTIAAGVYGMLRLSELLIQCCRRSPRSPEPHDHLV